MTGVHHDPWRYLHPKNHLSMDLLPSEIWGMNGTETAAGPVKTTAETWRNSHGVAIFLLKLRILEWIDCFVFFLFWVFCWILLWGFLVFIAFSVLSCLFCLFVLLVLCFYFFCLDFLFVCLSVCLYVCLFVCLFVCFLSLFCFVLFWFVLVWFVEFVLESRVYIKTRCTL